MGLVLSCTHLHVENNSPQSQFKLTNSQNANLVELGADHLTLGGGGGGGGFFLV